MGAIKAYLASGDLITLGTMVDERNKNIPDVPTLMEQGYDIASNNYFVCLFPKGTDKAIIDQFNAYVQKIVEENTEYQGKMKDMYFQAPFYADAEQSASILTGLYGDFAPLKKYF